METNRFYINKPELTLIGLYYLFIPLAIFFCSWVRPLIGVPLTILLGTFPILLRRQKRDHNVCRDNTSETVIITRRQLLVTVAVLLVWVVLSGIGGYVWQNRWDHAFRNALFNDLVNRSWPVADGESILTYYIGYWLPAAAMAKITGAMWVGRIVQLIYGFMGILLAFFLTVERVGNMKLRYLIPFIFFSGLDIIGIFLSGESIRKDLHIELWSSYACWESNTTIIFWVYNQAIPSWVGTMLLLNTGQQKGIPALTLCFLTISAPFSVVGLFPLTLYYVIRSSFARGKWWRGLKALISPVNIVGLLGALPVMLFFMLNNSTHTNVDLNLLTTFSGVKDLMLLLFVEVGVFVIFLRAQLKTNIEFYILFLTVLLCLFIHMGTSNDFNCRVELPLNFFMTTQIIIYISEFGKKSLTTRLLFLSISLLAIVTPFLEISRTLYQSLRHPQSQYISIKEESVFELDELRENFVADSIFPLTNPSLGFQLFNYP